MAAWLVVAVLIIRQGTVAGRPPAGQQQGQPSSWWWWCVASVYVGAVVGRHWRIRGARSGHRAKFL